MRRFEWLAEQINKNGYTLGAEVGTGEGTTGQYVLRNCKDVKLLQVAWYPKSMIKMWKPKAKQSWIDKVCKPYGHRIVVIEKPSTEAANEIEDDSLDFVFIDANHSYEHVKQDILAWYPKVKKGGLVSGHDFEDHYPGVKKAVRESFPDNVIADEISLTAKTWFIYKAKNIPMDDTILQEYIKVVEERT